jgi:chemotaxis-related protein WspD
MNEDRYIINNTQTDPSEHLILNDCWNKIGVHGDRSCDELQQVIHCHECPVYAAFGDSLLERTAPSGYLENWLRFLETPVDELKINSGDEAIAGVAGAISLMIFRLGKERFALPVRILQEVSEMSVIQPLPHRSNQSFLGLVSNRGEISLCASLHHLLHIPQAKETNGVNEETHSRMVVVGEDPNKWVFPVDEVYGIFRFYLHELQAAPVVVTKSETGYTKGVLDWEGYKVNFLDWELLFYQLNQKIL